jgi:hypothetical protein
MLDPLTALNVASSIVQLIDSGASLIKNAQEILKNGSLAELTNIDKLNNDLMQVAEDLKSQCNSKISTAEHPEDADKVAASHDQVWKAKF